MFSKKKYELRNGEMYIHYMRAFFFKIIINYSCNYGNKNVR